MMQIYLIASGSRGYASVVGIGSEIGGEREATLLYQFTTGLSPALMPMCAVALAAIFRGRPAQRNIISVSFFLFVLAVQFLWWTTAGRRSMTIIALISAVSFFAIYYRSQLNGRRVFIIAALVLAAIPILWFLWEGYYLLRIATDVSRGAENLSILNLGRARELSVNSNVEGQFVENIIRRPFLILTSLSIVREATNGVLWGWNIISQALLTIPSVLFPNKFEFIGPVLENLWYFELGVPLNDWTNTMFVEGYIDFYIFGFPIYVYIIYILFILIIKISIYSGYTAIVFFSYFNLSFSILSVETTTNALFVCIRSTLFVIFVALFVRFLQRGRWMGRQFS